MKNIPAISVKLQTGYLKTTPIDGQNIAFYNQYVLIFGNLFSNVGFVL